MADTFTHNRKNANALTFDAGKKRLRTEARIVLDQVLNEALARYATEFNAAIKRGIRPQVTFTPDELRALLLRSAQRELTPPVAAGTEVKR